MSDGSGKVEREGGRVSVERVLAQRDMARTERDRLYVVVRELLRSRDGPDADADAAWQAAREAVPK